MLFLLIVLLSALTAGVIWVLHRNQLRRQVEVVERTNDLPPLESTALPDFTPPPNAYDNTDEGSGAAPTTVMFAGDAPAGDAAAVAPTGKAQPTAAQAPSETMLWQDQVKLLKEKGDLESAVLLCQQHFPKAQAFQQAAVLLRLQLRQRIDQKQPAGAEASKLYRCAILADLFRSGAPMRPVNPGAALKGLSSVEFQYQQIGHQQLKLLAKSDIKQLEQLWGKPDRHTHAEEALGVLWETLCRT